MGQWTNFQLDRKVWVPSQLQEVGVLWKYPRHHKGQNQGKTHIPSSCLKAEYPQLVKGSTIWHQVPKQTGQGHLRGYERDSLGGWELSLVLRCFSTGLSYSVRSQAISCSVAFTWLISSKHRDGSWEHFFQCPWCVPCDIIQPKW
jgi:hypothetical protein